MASFTTTGSDTYPNGHVLQTIQDVNAAESSTTSSTFNATFGSALQVTITPVSSANKIFLFTSWEWEFAEAAGAGHADFYRDISGGATSLVIMCNSTTGEGVAAMYASDVSDRACISYSYLDAPDTTAAINYRPSLRNSGPGNMYIGSGGAGQCTLIAQEIKGS